MFQKLLRRKFEKFLDLLNVPLSPTCITAPIAKVHKLAIQNFQLPFKPTRCGVGDPSMRMCAEIYVRYVYEGVGLFIILMSVYGYEQLKILPMVELQ